jgi:hypothetical protein
MDDKLLASPAEEGINASPDPAPCPHADVHTVTAQYRDVPAPVHDRLRRTPGATATIRNLGPPAETIWVSWRQCDRCGAILGIELVSRHRRR